MNKTFFLVFLLFVLFQLGSHYFFQTIYSTANTGSGGIVPMSNGGMEASILFFCFYLINAALCLAILKWKKSRLLLQFVALTWMFLLLQGIVSVL